MKKKYRLLKDLPGTKEGVIFAALDVYDKPSTHWDISLYAPQGIRLPIFLETTIIDSSWFEEIEEQGKNFTKEDVLDAYKAGQQSVTHAEPVTPYAYGKGLGKRSAYECPYDLNSCSYVDQATGVLHNDCTKCERYGHGVRPTGATPILGCILDFIRK